MISRPPTLGLRILLCDNQDSYLGKNSPSTYVIIWWYIFIIIDHFLHQVRFILISISIRTIDIDNSWNCQRNTIKFMYKYRIYHKFQVFCDQFSLLWYFFLIQSKSMFLLLTLWCIRSSAHQCMHGWIIPSLFSRDFLLSGHIMHSSLHNLIVVNQTRSQTYRQTSW